MCYGARLLAFANMPHYVILFHKPFGGFVDFVHAAVRFGTAAGFVDIAQHKDARRIDTENTETLCGIAEVFGVNFNGTGPTETNDSGFFTAFCGH